MKSTPNLLKMHLSFFWDGWRNPFLIMDMNFSIMPASSVHSDGKFKFSHCLQTTVHQSFAIADNLGEVSAKAQVDYKISYNEYCI